MAAERIFWLGAHKVLKTTELPQLRALGFEVFAPPYISPIYDQSMDLEVDRSQPSSLPPSVFDELLTYNFFYNDLTPRIASLLNEYFSSVIVTINPDWLIAFLKKYSGPIIYRVYGQHYSLSEHLISRDAWRTFVERDNLNVVPFASESVEREHQWFTDKCRIIVPYQIPDDVFDKSDSWRGAQHRSEIAVNIPNIENAYYTDIYKTFSRAYPHRVFRVYGPQRRIPPDDRIVGGISRQSFLQHLSESSGYLYPYTDDVCYLPPIESMEIGLPVLYAGGSLLSKFYKGATPGLIRDELDVEKKLRLLISGDQVFTDEIIAAQDGVRERYDRAYVRPRFAEAFQVLLGRAPAAGISTVSDVVSAGSAPAFTAPPKRVVYIFAHFDGFFVYAGAKVVATEGIPRVIDRLVDTIINGGEYSVVITCNAAAAPAMHEFFGVHLRSGRARLHVVVSAEDRSRGDDYAARLELILEVNDQPDVVCVVVPHYYLFPEALLLEKRIALYLPDYFPHLMPGVTFDTSPEKDAENKSVGVAIARKPGFILTNSEYTKNYLVAAGFVDTAALDKVVVAPLPLLGSNRATPLNDQAQEGVAVRFGGAPFLFYPTANRPNKQIAFLFKVFAWLRLDYPELRLALTCDLDSVPGVRATAENLEVMDYLVMLPRVDESALRWLYENTAALCLTSTVEGNFPPQVFEALHFKAPVVSTRLEQIVEALGEESDHLLLCRPKDLAEFRSAVLRAIRERDGVLARQENLLVKLATRSSEEKLYAVIGPHLSALPKNASLAAPQ